VVGGVATLSLVRLCPVGRGLGDVDTGDSVGGVDVKE
jgi:hypothetical protein